MMIRFLLGPHAIRFTDTPLVFFRVHQGSKTISRSSGFDRERLYIKRAALDWIADPSFKAICRRTLQRFVWHRCVDRIGNKEDLDEGKRVAQLLMLMARRPSVRLDRYALGRIRRLI
jgi:hypothetical protein